MRSQRVTCNTCGRRVLVLPSGKLRAHNDGTHGPHEAFRGCPGSGQDQSASDVRDGGESHG